MLYINKIGRILTTFFPINKQDKNDNSGWVYKEFNKKTRTVIITIDVTEKTLEEAINNNSKFIISHRPISPKKKLGRKINASAQKLYKKLKESGITLLVLNTNYNNSPIGITYSMAQKLPFKTKIHPPKLLLKANMPIEEFASQIKESLKLKNVMLFKNNDDEDIKAVLIPGGFSHLVQSAYEDYANTFISGEFKWNELQQAKDLGLNIIQVTEGVERVFIDHISDVLSKNCLGLNIIKSFPDSNLEIY